MGITFRDGGYTRHIRIGKRTIKEGEFALVWDVNGRCTKYQGPRLVRFWYSTIRFCTNYIASEKQYLVVSHKDGRTVHTPGPCSQYLDHLLHRDIKVENAVQVAADECLVVYNDIAPHAEDVKDAVEGSPEKLPASTEIKYGPCLFFPKVRQTVETFAWTNKNTLSLREQRDSVSVAGKTKDDHEITNKFSLTWKIEKTGVEKLLGATQNPFTELSYALKIDVTKQLSSQVHDDFIKNKNPFGSDTFGTLNEKAAEIGVKVCQLHFEGYEINSARLKERNAQAKAKSDEERRLKDAEEKERLNDFQLEKKMARAEKQAESNLEEVNQRIQIVDREHTAKLDREMKEHRQRLEQQRELSLVKSEYLKQLKENEVDLTKYLIAVVLGERRKAAKKNNEDDEEEDFLDIDFMQQKSPKSPTNV